jgi:hypothetical protein
MAQSIKIIFSLASTPSSAMATLPQIMAIAMEIPTSLVIHPASFEVIVMGSPTSNPSATSVAFLALAASWASSVSPSLAEFGPSLVLLGPFD